MLTIATITEKHIIAAVAFEANDKGAADRGVRWSSLSTLNIYIHIHPNFFLNTPTYSKVQLQDVASRAKRTTSRFL